MNIAENVAKIMDKVVAFRREIHKNPELSMQEFETTARILAALKAVPNLEVRDLNPGVVAVLKGKTSGKALALRADMDALSMEEDSGLPFSSINKGVCHACGHDMHTALLLGCAMLLGPLADQLTGSITFLFQPGEEDQLGAQHMLKHKVLDNPNIDAIFGIHCNGREPVGCVSITPGPCLASADSIEVVVKGRAGHAGFPQKSVDSVVIAAQVIMAVQTLSSRWCDPTDPLVVSICTLHGGTAHNAIASDVHMTGTVRTVSAEVRKAVPTQLEQIISHTAQTFGGTGELVYNWGTPPVVNDRELAAFATRYAAEVVGAENVHHQDKPVMGGEDFAFYMEKVPGLFIFLGTESDDPLTKESSHNPRVRFDEGMLPVGIQTLSHLARCYLENKK